VEEARGKCHECRCILVALGQGLWSIVCLVNVL